MRGVVSRALSAAREIACSGSASCWQELRLQHTFGTVKQIFLVGLGGLIGSIGRYKLSGLLLHNAPDWRFPLGTFAVNIIGCFVIGLLAGWAEKYSLNSDLRVFLFPGILGGFTTFSAFGFETFTLLRRGDWHMAFFYVILSVVFGLLLVWLGFKLIGGGTQA